MNVDRTDTSGWKHAENGREESTPAAEASRRTQALLLSWEQVRFSRPAASGSGGKRCRGLLSGWVGPAFNMVKGCARRGGHTEDNTSSRLTILNDVSGFAGPIRRPFSEKGSNPSVMDKGKASVVVGVPIGKEEHSGETSGGGGGGGGDEYATGVTALTRQESGLAGLPTEDDDRPWTGSVTAIMGPSGAGKTSLLNILAGRTGGAASRAGVKITGKVRVNGEEVDDESVRGVSGYVTQEDVLPETLTCFEHLMFHAELRMLRSSRRARRDRVLEVRRNRKRAKEKWGG